MSEEKNRLSRGEIITLGEKIMRAEGTEAEIDANIALFKANCQNPRGTDLIFWPHGFPHDPTRPEPSAEDIVEQALMPGQVVLL